VAYHEPGVEQERPPTIDVLDADVTADDIADVLCHLPIPKRSAGYLRAPTR
jgi:hypothetical protein